MSSSAAAQSCMLIAVAFIHVCQIGVPCYSDNFIYFRRIPCGDNQCEGDLCLFQAYELVLTMLKLHHVYSYFVNELTWKTRNWSSFRKTLAVSGSLHRSSNNQKNSWFQVFNYFVISKTWVKKANYFNFPQRRKYFDLQVHNEIDFNES